MLYPICILPLFISSSLSLILYCFVYSCRKKGEYTREYCHFYMTLMHILKGRNSIGEIHIPRGRRHLFMRKTCFILFYIMFVFLFSLWCFELLLVSMLCCSHRIVFICWTFIHPYAIMLYWLHIWMIICFAMWSL